MKLCPLCGMDSKQHVDTDGEYHDCVNYAVELLIEDFVIGLERQAAEDEANSRIKVAITRKGG